MPKEPEPDGRSRPSGRVAVMDAVLDAATELMADRGPNAVAVRAIASRAGVNHALVHRYFGSKDDLIKAVVQREAAHFAGLAAAEGDPVETIGRLLAELAQRRGYVRFLARALLDGYRPEQLQPDFSIFGQMLGLVSQAGVTPARPGGHADARISFAALAAQALGWRIFGDFIAFGLALEDVPREELDGRIDAFITSVVLARPADLTPGAGGS